MYLISYHEAHYKNPFPLRMLFFFYFFFICFIIVPEKFFVYDENKVLICLNRDFRRLKIVSIIKLGKSLFYSTTRGKSFSKSIKLFLICSISLPSIATLKYKENNCSVFNGEGLEKSRSRIELLLTIWMQRWSIYMSIYL